MLDQKSITIRNQALTPGESKTECGRERLTR
jgi:hypothetical protein